MGIAEEQIVNFMQDFSYDKLPDRTKESVRRLMIDALACTVAGVSSTEYKEAIEGLLANDNVQQSTVVGYNTRSSVATAAFANAILAHSNEYDDTHDTSHMHSGACLAPVALAMGEYCSMSGAKTLEAFMVGTEVACRIGKAIKSKMSQGWMPTSICGSIGAAAIACKILEFGKEQTISALGIAAGMSGGNRQALLNGTQSKRSLVAFPAKIGVMSALLAQGGVTGPEDFLSGDYGIFKLFAGSDCSDSFLAGLREAYMADEISLKPYPCCRSTHAAIDGAIELAKKEIFVAEDIKKVTVRSAMGIYERVGRPFEVRQDPTIDAQFSLPYTVALALTKQAVTLSDFLPDTVRGNLAVIDLAGKIEVVPVMDRSVEALTPVDMELVTLKDNKIFHRVERLKGDPLYPLTNEEFKNKLIDCVKFAGEGISSKFDTILPALEGFEGLENVGDLMETIKCG